MSVFKTPLIVRPLSDGKSWVIVSKFHYDVREENSGDRIHVDVGFVTDFASVPRLFIGIVPRWGKYGNAAVIHDWLYWNQPRSRQESDKIFYEAMGCFDVSTWKKKALYISVRLFGRYAWKKNQLERQRGYERVMSIEEMVSKTDQQLTDLPRPSMLRLIREARENKAEQ